MARTVADVFNSFTEEQKNVLYYIIGEMMGDDGAEEGEAMNHSVFENDNPATVISHGDMEMIMEDARRIGSLREAFASNLGDDVLAHTITDDAGATIGYGMANIGYLFPDAKPVSDVPDFIKRNDEWVSEVMNAVSKTPFSRVKSIHANITMNEARAKGYVKGAQKAEEIFTLLKRTTTPQTIYKKQKMDKDDIIDITGFDVLNWLKAEMRAMLNEEIARAVMVGDGRTSADPDKIMADHIRPIWTDNDLYTIKVTVAEGDDGSKTAKNVIKGAIKSRKNYKGSGKPVFFTTEDMLADMLLITDTTGRDIYADEAALAKKLRVEKIVTVPVFENLTDSDGNILAGIIVNLKDYNIGADKGGNVNFFDDFDIDYNQEKYLIETRCSGALIKPYSAIAISVIPAEETGGGEEEDDDNPEDET